MNTGGIKIKRKEEIIGGLAFLIMGLLFFSILIYDSIDRPQPIPPTETCDVIIKAIDKDNNPVDMVEIKIYDHDCHPLLESGWTDENGLFEIDLDTGRYFIIGTKSTDEGLMGYANYYDITNDTTITMRLARVYEWPATIIGWIVGSISILFSIFLLIPKKKKR